MVKINIAHILETRECPGCRSCKPGRKSDCEIRKCIVYGMKTTEPMRQWCEKQVMTGACKQRRPR